MLKHRKTNDTQPRHREVISLELYWNPGRAPYSFIVLYMLSLAMRPCKDREHAFPYFD